MEVKSALNYESPRLNVVDVESEGIICYSSNTEHVDKNDGIW